MTAHFPTLREALRVAPRQAVGFGGLLLGTPVLTLDGELPVEHVFAGDRIVTREGLAVLREVRVRRAILAPIRVQRRSFGPGRPVCDTLLAPEARVHRLGRPLAPLQRLICGDRVRVEPSRDVTLFSLVFDRPRLIYAAGLELLAA